MLRERREARAVLSILLVAGVLAAGCGETGSGGGGGESVDGGVNPTPQKLDGTPSYEFEQDDLDAAEGASDAVKDYCSGAVSEAQRIGCEAHVTEDQIP